MTVMMLQWKLFLLHLHLHLTPQTKIRTATKTIMTPVPPADDNAHTHTPEERTIEPKKKRTRKQKKTKKLRKSDSKKWTIVHLTTSRTQATMMSCAVEELEAPAIEETYDIEEWRRIAKWNTYANSERIEKGGDNLGNYSRLASSEHNALLEGS